jgi:hypothetical protein
MTDAPDYADIPWCEHPHCHDRVHGDSTHTDRLIDVALLLILIVPAALLALLLDWPSTPIWYAVGPFYGFLVGLVTAWLRDRRVRAPDCPCADDPYGCDGACRD